MSYSDDPIINEIVLVVVNDGNGKQCGMTYQQRCDAAENGLADYVNACLRFDRQRVADGGAPAVKRAIQVRGAAEIIQAYYRQHVAEVKAGQP